MSIVDWIGRDDWIGAIRRYVTVGAAVHLLWEIVQLPLYTLWRTGTRGEQAFAVIHCTGGDVLIAGSSLLMALLAAGHRSWPAIGFFKVAGLTVVIGIGYTIYSEWLNTSVRLSWSYSELMPIVPVIGTGLSPLLQWVVVPMLALWAARGRAGEPATGAAL